MMEATEAKTYRVQEVKKALKKSPFVDSFFVSKYGCSPYRACEHACAYCDGRAEKYYVEGDFEHEILIRRSLPAMLRQELRKVKERCPIHFASGVSDPYQPAEAEEGLMRRCAEVVLEAGFPATLLTKSKLVMRDLDIWEQVHRQGGFTLQMTITYASDELRAIFEPGASTIPERLATLAAFKAKGIPVGVMAMPLLPGLGDTPEAMESLVCRLKDVGVDFIIPGELTLRPGRQKEHYLHVLARHFPHLVPYYTMLYAENRASGRPLASLAQKLYPTFKAILDRYEIPMFAPHPLYRNRFPQYLEILILLEHMTYLYADKQREVRRLNQAIGSYKQWLEERVHFMNRSRNRTPEQLDGELRDRMEAGTFATLLGNEKLAAFLAQVVLQGKMFDYRKRVLY